MRVQRHFLGWNEPVARKVCAWLLPASTPGWVDLEGTLVIVPTRQAGRRLREALAKACAGRHAALISARVVPPAYFLREAPGENPSASPCLVRAAWSRLLIKLKLRDMQGLFPSEPPSRDLAWALHMADLLQNLRNTLADGGLSLGDVPVTLQGAVPEPERWGDLARLEKRYLKELKNLGVEDPLTARMRRARNPERPDGVERVVVAAVPDPSQLVLRAWERLAEDVDFDVLVHAPPDRAADFDAWGRPLRDAWQGVKIDIPEEAQNLHLAASPSAQARRALDLMAEEKTRYTPAQMAIGVPDAEVVQPLAERLGEAGLPAYDPAGRSAAAHPLLHFLKALERLVSSGSFEALAAFLRHPDVLDCLLRREQIAPQQLLKEADLFQNKHLPQTIDDIWRRLSRGKGATHHPALYRAVAWVRETIALLRGPDLATALRQILLDLYDTRMLRPGVPEDEAFAAVAALANDLLDELATPELRQTGLEPIQLLRLAIEGLGEARYYLDHEEPAIDLEGWLELPWIDAPFLLVTGMNEGRVPDGRLSDLFLPDSLRARLGLRSDVDRLARDGYLMTTLIESRRESGRAAFIVGKNSLAGDPLKPSRLLFRCVDPLLPARAARLFGEAQDLRENVAASISFKFNPVPPPGAREGRLNPTRLSVTSFRRYLTCPFRYYLQVALEMEALDDRARSMDALAFGLMAHGALEFMANSDELRECADERRLASALEAVAEDWVREHYGKRPTLEIVVQLEAVKQRLGAMARAQVAHLREGWKIIEWEQDYTVIVDGITIRGRIDRVDQHAETGALLVLDYKTSDNKTLPKDAHLGTVREHHAEYARLAVNGRDKAWVDLQLPLYEWLLEAKGYEAEAMRLGYFHLPKAVNETGITVWDEFTPELSAAARTCARGVIADVRARRFWPPADKVTYDDYAALFPAAPEACFDAGAFQRFMEAAP